MNQEKTIEIPLSKMKLLKLLFFSMVFITIGYFFIAHPSEFAKPPGNQGRIWYQFLGLLSITFFGAGFIIISIRFFSNAPGLIITEDGFKINPRPFSTTFVSWEKIKRFEIISISQSKQILIILKEPEVYISQLKSRTSKSMAKFNLKSFGGPLSIASNDLKIKFDDLYNLLNEELTHYNNKQLEKNNNTI